MYYLTTLREKRNRRSQGERDQEITGPGSSIGPANGEVSLVHTGALLWIPTSDTYPMVPPYVCLTSMTHTAAMVAALFQVLPPFPRRESTQALRAFHVTVSMSLKVDTALIG